MTPASTLSDSAAPARSQKQHFHNAAVRTDFEERQSTNHTNIDAEQRMDTIMSKLLGDPFDGLDAQYTGSILIIFEAYRALAEDKTRLLSELQAETDRRYVTESEIELAEHRWQLERQHYKIQVEKLEVLVARGKGGLATVMEATRGSTLQRSSKSHDMTEHDHRDTVSYLDGTRAEDHAGRKNQRGP